METTIDAIDVANFTEVMNPFQASLLRAFGVRRVIVGGSYGTIARAQLEASIANGFETEAYAWITAPFSPLRIANVLNEIEGLAVKRIWLDAEDEAASQFSAAENIANIRSAIALVRLVRPDLEIGIYSGAGWWRANTDDYSGDDICSLPLWFANYRNPDGVSDYRTLLFGGWPSAAMWQYVDQETGGLNTDRSMILEDNVVDSYSKAEVDEKVGALLRLGIAHGSQIAAVTTALADHVANHNDTSVNASEAALQQMVDDLKTAQEALTQRIESAAAILHG